MAHINPAKMEIIIIVMITMIVKLMSKDFVIKTFRSINVPNYCYYW